jgi:hypothetical protein
MNKITIDLVKLIEQATLQVVDSIDPLLLRQWVDRNTGAMQPVIVDLAAVSIKNEAEATLPTLPYLLARVNDVTTFSDESELRIHVLAPRGSREDLATDAYYGLLVAISDV